MTKKKHSLKIDLFEEIPSFRLFGIVSGINMVRMAWHINQQLSIDFERQESIVLDNIKQAIRSEHAFFSFCNEEDLLTYSLLVNKNGNGRLLPELANIDYFLKIDDNNDLVDPDDVLHALENISSVNFVFDIETEKLKNLENILL